MSRRDPAAGDVVVLLVLMATVLSLFDDTFADRRYLVAGMAPVVSLLALAVATRRMREGGWWYTLAAMVLFTPLAALAALREPGPFLVPTWDTMSQLLADSVGAPVVLVSTVPPVDPSGEVVLVPYLVGFLATLPAAWLALGTTRSSAPVVPVLVALVATIPLGVLEPTLMVPRGILLGVVAFGWVAVRDRRREGAVATQGTAASVTAAVVTIALVSVVAGAALPELDPSDRTLLRGEGSAAHVADAATTVLPRRPANEDIRLFKVRGLPDGRRMRFAALDRYTRDGWIPAEESPGSQGYGTFKRIGPEVAALHTGNTAVVRVELRPGYASDWLPLTGELTALHLDWNPGRTTMGDVRYNQATSSALVIGGVDVRDQYAFEAVLGRDSFTRRDRTREPTDEQRQPDGAFLDPLLEPFDRDELLPLERVLLLARYLRLNGAVRDADVFDQSPAALGRRMLGTRRPTGTPFQFSALMALGASRLGVAARMVTGAQPGAGGLVDYGDVTSWVELQLADGTWRTLAPERYVGAGRSGQGEDPGTFPGTSEFVADQLAWAVAGRDPEIRPPDGSLDADGTPVDKPRPAWQVVVGAIVAVGAAALLALGLVPAVKLLRRRRRQRSTSWSGLFVNGWQEVLDAARDRGSPVPDTWSRVAQARTIGVGLDVARRADVAVFAPGPSDEDASAYWQACMDLRRELLGSAGSRRRRWWALVNPSSLVASWARRRAGESSPVR